MYTVYSVSKIITNLNVTNLIWSNFNELEPISISFAHKISSEWVEFNAPLDTI